MQEIKHVPVSESPNNFNWLASIVLLSTTLLSIWGLFIYSFIQESSIENTQNEILQLESDIRSASTDKNIIIANILKSTTIRPSLDLKGVVDSLYKTAAWARVRLQGFSVKEDLLNTTLIATQDNSGWDPVATIITMMRSNLKTWLQLGPITSLAGTPNERSTGVSFQILPSKPTNNANK